MTTETGRYAAEVREIAAAAERLRLARPSPGIAAQVIGWRAVDFLTSHRHFLLLCEHSAAWNSRAGRWPDGSYHVPHERSR